LQRVWPSLGGQPQTAIRSEFSRASHIAVEILEPRIAVSGNAAIGVHVTALCPGFTVSEFDAAKLLTAAVIDQARKHRKRPPDEIRRIEEHRKTRSR